MNPFQNIYPSTVLLSYTKDPKTGQLRILEENHYYPFGLKHEVYTPPTSKGLIKDDDNPGNTQVSMIRETEYMYKYQGQELQDELGLNWYSFKWRNYMPDIGRFFNHDPLSEKYTYNSPYAFQENKMGMGRELEGLELVKWAKDKYKQGKKWVKDNLVVEGEVKVTIGAQAGIKTGFGKIEGGLVTTELVKAGVSTEKGTYVEPGDGKGHNFAGANVKAFSEKLSVGAEVDYVTNDVVPPDGSDIGEYYSNNGELQWGVNLGPGRSSGTGIKGDYDFISSAPTVKADSECKCAGVELGIKALVGFQFNMRMGKKNNNDNKD